jgi:DNA polymerase-1
VQNAFGRVRYLYGPENDILKQALNTPIQSAAASIINRAAVAIWQRLQAEGFQTRIQAQIHDELGFVVPRSEVPQIAKLVREEMERPVEFRGTKRSFEIDIETGPSWGDLKELS